MILSSAVYKLAYLSKCCELKELFLHVWHGIDETIIDNATDEWRGRRSFFAYVCKQKADTFRHMTRDVPVFVKCDDF